jgi:glutamyl-tRNA reductase
MNLVLVGMNHRTAPVEVRERMNIHESRLAEALTNLVRRQGILEGMIISTCNRVEVVSNAEDGVEGVPLVRQFLLDYHHCDLTPWEHHFYWYRQEEAVRHLFRVASSLDSMILGEPQILGQVKRAYTTARQAGALAGTLNEVVNQALAVARRVRRETALGSAAVSVSYAAVELAKKIFGSLQGKTVFLLGAGKMSELSARHLLQSGARAIFVSNRTYDRAVELASAFNGVAVHFDEVFDYLEKADIVISSTGAPHFIVTKEQAERLLAARRQRPIFFVDIAVPRDIDPAVNELDNVFVYDIDDLQQVVDANMKQREREAVWAESIVSEEVQKMTRRLATRDVVPTILALEQRMNLIRQAELERFRGRLGNLTPEQRETVEALTRAILNKILHGPVTELKSGAGRPEHRALVQLIRRIFGVSD